MNLDGKVALITGGGTGIGAAIAKRFVSDGAKVCITGRRREVLEKMAASLPPGTVAVCPGDVSKYADVELMVQTTLSFNGKLDILVNDAAWDCSGAITDLDPVNWRKVLEVNLTGPFQTMKASIPVMIKGGGGSIINIASLGGLRSMPASPAYCSSKAGLIALTQQAALEYGPSKVRSNVVCPGAVRTTMLEETVGGLAKEMHTDIDTVLARFSSKVPLRRVSKPEEITGICSYLASDDSSFMTGAVLVIDGGAAVVDVSGASIG